MLVKKHSTRLRLILALSGICLAACPDSGSPVEDITDAGDDGRTGGSVTGDADAPDADAPDADAPDADAPDAASESDASSSRCFSPTQNLGNAYAADAEGCPCTDQDEDQCIQGVALICQGGTWQAVEDGPCLPMSYTEARCQSAGGVALFDPGDGSAIAAGCPRGLPELGALLTDGGEGGLCCKQTLADCVSQKVHGEGECSGQELGIFYIVGGCMPLSGCDCVGDDCDHGFSDMASCESAYASCADVVTRCGGWYVANKCEDDQFCAFRGLVACGAGDGSAICEPRPETCDDVDDPVCGCDGQDYANACEAARAGQGVLSFGSCTS